MKTLRILSVRWHRRSLSTDTTLNKQYAAFLVTGLQTTSCHNLIDLQVYQAKNKTKAKTVHVSFEQHVYIYLRVDGNVKLLHVLTLQITRVKIIKLNVFA